MAKRIYKVRSEDLSVVEGKIKEAVKKYIGEENVAVFKDGKNIKISNRVNSIKNSKDNKYRVYILIQQMLNNLNLDYKIINL